MPHLSARCAPSGVPGGWLLSWTIAPEARGKGYGKAMVAAMVKQLNGPLRAETTIGNIASEHIARAIGMKLKAERNGVRYWKSTTPR